MSKTQWLAIISLFIFSIALRIYGIGDRALWADEKVTAMNANGLLATEPIGNLKTTFIDSNVETGTFQNIKKATLLQDSGNGFLYYVMISGWSNFFGNSDYSLRFPSFLASILLLIIGFSFVKKYFNVQTAILFLAASSIFSLFIIYSQTARSYELALLTTFSSTFVFWELISKLKEKSQIKIIAYYSILYFILLFTSIFLHYYTFYIFAGHAVFLVIHHYKEKKTLLLFSGIYIAFSIVLLFWMLNGGFEGYRLMADKNSWWVEHAINNGTYFNPSHLINSFSTFLIAMLGVYNNYIKYFNVYLLIPYLVSILLLLYAFIKSNSSSLKSNKIISLFVYSIVIQLLFAVSMVFKNGHTLSLTPYYNIFTIPYFLIILVYLANEVRIGSKYAKISNAFIALFVVYNLVFIYHYHSKKNIFHSEENNPYVTAAHLIDQQISVGDTVVSKQWIDGQLISLYSTKSFNFTCEPTLEEDKIYLKQAGNSMASIVSLEGKRY
jgi:uncharacterized membrane protein